MNDQQRINKQLAEDIARDIRAGSTGGTYNVDGDGMGGFITCGYVVGGAGPVLVKSVGDVTSGDIEAWLNNGPHSDLVGFWVDEDSIYLDWSEWVGLKRSAIRKAYSRGELAIWDAANGVSIETGVREVVK